VRTPDGRYGTRSSTLVIGQRIDGGARLRVRVTERTHDRDGRAIEQRSVTLERWTGHDGQRAPVVSRAL
jgi:uncharacterized protein with NRDE domain